MHLEDLITRVNKENEYLHGIKHNHSYVRVGPQSPGKPVVTERWVLGLLGADCMFVDNGPSYKEC